MKNDYFTDKINRLKQEIKVLISKPAFQKDIADLRKNWDIPVSGIKTEEENQNWEKALSNATNEYYMTEWPKCRAEVEELNAKKQFVEAREKSKQCNAKAPKNAFHEDLWSIVRKYRLSPRWHNGIRRYLLFNDPKSLNLFVGVTVVTTWENDVERITLEIDENTTLEDIKHVWPKVKLMQKNLTYRQADKFQPITNFERDKRIYELSEEGKSTNDIGDIVQEEFGDSLDYNQINIAIKRYKKRLNIS